MRNDFMCMSKLKVGLKNTTIDKTLTYASETWMLTKRDRKQLNIFERKVYRRILGPVCDNEKGNCVCTAQCREALCVLHSVERHCVCTAQCREALCVYSTV